jgi:hypothetical protein
MLDEIINSIGTTKFRFTGVVFIIFIILIFLKTPHGSDDDYDEDCPREKMDIVLKKITKKSEKPMHDKMWLACKDGLVKGAVTGSITGGLVGAVSGGFVFALANPILLYIHEG